MNEEGLEEELVMTVWNFAECRYQPFRMPTNDAEAQALIPQDFVTQNLYRLRRHREDTVSEAMAYVLRFWCGLIEVKKDE